MKPTFIQMDMFTTAPAAVPRIAASVPKASAATIGSERPKPITEDIPTLVVDGIKNLTYTIQ